jgi:hypothetical protein
MRGRTQGERRSRVEEEEEKMHRRTSKATGGGGGVEEERGECGCGDVAMMAS